MSKRKDLVRELAQTGQGIADVMLRLIDIAGRAEATAPSVADEIYDVIEVVSNLNNSHLTGPWTKAGRQERELAERNAAGGKKLIIDITKEQFLAAVDAHAAACWAKKKKQRPDARTWKQAVTSALSEKLAVEVEMRTIRRRLPDWGLSIEDIEKRLQNYEP